MSKSAAKPTKVTVRVLTGLVNNRGAVARELGVTATQVKPFIADGLVKQIGTRKNVDENGKALRGRPSHELALTDKGRKRARRIVAQTEDSQPVAA